MADWRKKMRDWSVKEMRDLQDAKLRSFLRDQVYPFSPFYRRVLDREGIDVLSLRTVEDLARVPFTTKSDIAPTQEEPDRFRDFVLQPDKGLIRRHASKTSLARFALKRLLQGATKLEGQMEAEYAPVFSVFTTGRTAAPTPFLFTLYDFKIWDVHSARTMSIIKEQTGYKPGQLIVNAFPYAPHGGFWQVYRMTSLQGLMTLQSGGGKTLGTERILDVVSGGGAIGLVAIPGYLYHLLRIAKEEGRSLRSLKLLITGGERAHCDYREKVLQLARDCGAENPVFLAAGGFTEQKHYPVECTEGVKGGYHTWPDLDFFEIVDPKTGARLPDDASGELVYTALDGRGSIVLRYRTGDLVEAPAIRHDPCSGCGLRIPRINSLISRSTDIKEMNLTKLKGTLVNLNLLSSVIPVFPDVKEWQVEIRKKDDDPFSNDEMIVYIAPEEGAAVDELRMRIDRRMRQVMEVTPTKILFEPLDRLLERLKMETEMKELRIVDRRPIQGGKNLV